jgi:hypothetical protein
MRREQLTWISAAIVAIGGCGLLSSARMNGSLADCAAFSVKSVPVVLGDGRPVYIEPSAVVSSGDRLLVAGSPSYVWNSHDKSTADSRNTLFGAVITGDGTAQSVPSPLEPGHLSDVRAVALGNGLWAAAFADVRPDTQFNPNVWPKVDGYRWNKMAHLGTNPIANRRTAAGVRISSYQVSRRV